MYDEVAALFIAMAIMYNQFHNIDKTSIRAWQAPSLYSKGKCIR